MAAGPTAENPGPTLLKQAIVALKFVSISNGSSDSNIKIEAMQTIYSEKYDVTALSVVSSTILYSKLMLRTLRGWRTFFNSLYII